MEPLPAFLGHHCVGTARGCHHSNAALAVVLSPCIPCCVSCPAASHVALLIPSGASMLPCIQGRAGPHRRLTSRRGRCLLSCVHIDTGLALPLLLRSSPNVGLFRIFPCCSNPASQRPRCSPLTLTLTRRSCINVFCKTETQTAKCKSNPNPNAIRSHLFGSIQKR